MKGSVGKLFNEEDREVSARPSVSLAKSRLDVHALTYNLARRAETLNPTFVLLIPKQRCWR